MAANPNCPQCGAELPPDFPPGLCPKCLLAAGLESHASHPSGATQTAQRTRFQPPTPAELTPRFPQLEILELLGHGGMGAVYKARQITLDRLVALKILPVEVGQDPAFAERFAREARALARLNHPGIVSVYDFGQTDGLYYFVMEYVDGANVRQLIQTGGLAPKEALAIVPQICDALQFAHDEGVIHRDIKPENLLVDTKGRVKIADFGLAKLLGLAAEDFNLTHTRQVMGTPHYMAPEQIEKPLSVDHRTDIYSLGVVFYEMLTGELPLGRFAPPSRKAQIDVRLDEIVMRTLENKPELRYQQVSQVKTDVQTITGVSPAVWRRAFGNEYRSRTTFFGLPLLHIAFGFDPATGKKRVAKGIFAIGDTAVGVVAIGGVTVGGLCLGGLAVGLVGFGGLAVALAAIGGLALGGFAFGGLALGGIALGGVALGVYASGGVAFGLHVITNEYQDPVALSFFSPWAFDWWKWLVGLSIAFPIVQGLTFLFVWRLLRKQNQPKPVLPPDDGSAWVCAVVSIVCFTVGILLPAVLLAVLGDRDEHVAFAALTFLAALVLAIVFGKLGARYALGRYSFRAALVAFLLVFIAGLGWFFALSGAAPDDYRGPMPMEMDRPATESASSELYAPSTRAAEPEPPAPKPDR